MLLTRLRQICCHPILFLKKYDGGSGKLKQCLDLIVDAIESGHKILLFSSYTSIFERIENELNNFIINHQEHYNKYIFEDESISGKKLPRVFRDSYEYKLEPSEYSIKILNREYK